MVFCSPYTISGKYTDATIFADIHKLEESTISQVQDIINNDCSHGCTVSIMPDCHAGKGCVIGTTMSISDRIVPNLVGVDINCGMLAVNLGKIEINLPTFDNQVHRSIPSGFNSRNTIHPKVHELVNIKELRCYDKLKKVEDAPYYQIGTLGGGNHFISLEKSSSSGDIYLIIHSGSRNLGKKVAEYYQNLAISTRKQERETEREEIIQSGKNNDPTIIGDQLARLNPLVDELAYLQGKDMEDYIYDIWIVGVYASANRWIMATEIFDNVPELNGMKMDWFETVHNFYDPRDMILRKGAISAHQGEKVIIPLNMRDGSIIAIGRGNPEWNYSAPHGAGRVMGRKEAKRILTFDKFKECMDGIYSTSVTPNTIDESPFVYKPIEDIIDIIPLTVDIIDRLYPIYNFKA